eukprot:scaffold9491_cov150-Isochrysis_galbana.AAC.4
MCIVQCAQSVCPVHSALTVCSSDSSSSSLRLAVHGCARCVPSASAVRAHLRRVLRNTWQHACGFVLAGAKALRGSLTWRVPTDGWHRSPTLTAADGGSMTGPAKHPSSLRHPTKKISIRCASGRMRHRTLYYHLAD